METLTRRKFLSFSLVAFSSLPLLESCSKMEVKQRIEQRMHPGDILRIGSLGIKFEGYDRTTPSDNFSLVDTNGKPFITSATMWPLAKIGFHAVWDRDKITISVNKNNPKEEKYLFDFGQFTTLDPQFDFKKGVLVKAEYSRNKKFISFQ